MYGRYKKYSRKPRKKKMSATKKAYLRGLARGKAIARRGRSHKRWY